MNKFVNELLECFEIEKKDKENLLYISNLIYNSAKEYSCSILDAITGYHAMDVLEEVEDIISVDEVYEKLGICEFDSIVELCKYISLISFEDDFEEAKTEFEEMFKNKKIKVDISNLGDVFKESNQEFFIQLSNLLNNVGYTLVTFTSLEEAIQKYTFIQIKNKQKFENSLKEIFDNTYILSDYKIY